MPTRMPVEKRLELRRLYWAGVKHDEIMTRVGCGAAVIGKLIRKFPWKPRDRNPRNLSLAEREEISIGLSRGESLRSIARRLGRAPSTISREAAKRERCEYRAFLADERAERLMARPKPKKLASHPQLKEFVVAGLEQKWSPAQIVLRLQKAYPDDSTMRIAAETIYQSLYVQGRGGLRKELKKHLRQMRPKRRSQAPRGGNTRGHIRDMVNISSRPPEVADRAVPGHWEGDLIVGKQQKSAIGTLVERSTRYVMLLHLPNGWTAEEVRKALTKKIQTLPTELRKSLTWDQGHELAQHAKFTVDTGVDVYFCDPHSPWQRGSNENTNGLLRQYFPKSTHLHKYDAATLDAVARELNGRPRQTLDGNTPAEKFNELLKAA